MGEGGTTRPAVKRRRVTAYLQSPVALTVPTSLVSTPFVSTKPPLCSTCHRAFGGRSSLLLQCARCRAPTCTICSRTCSACPPSMPPTPALTHSSTPTASPSPSPSPKRTALALNTNATNANGAASPLAVSPFVSGRRRKLSTVDPDDEGGYVIPEGEEKAGKEDWMPGCGRTVCRNCCFESTQSNTTTCYDCYGRPFNALPQDLDRSMQSLTQPEHYF